MKFFKKISSVLLSLVLCGSMVAPAFAANFGDLNTAINASLEGEYFNDHSIGDNRYGFGKKDESSGKWDIEAWDEDNTRHIVLNENVERDPDPKETGAVSPDAESIFISTDNVEIKMNGKDIISNGGGSSVFVVDEGRHLTVDAGEDKTGKVGTIQGGSAVEGGAVHVKDGGSFEMTGGMITGNKAIGFDDPDYSLKGNGGAIYAETGSKVTLNDTVVTGNTADDNGDGIYAEAGAEVELTGTAKVSGNGKEDVYL